MISLKLSRQGIQKVYRKTRYLHLAFVASLLLIALMSWYSYSLMRDSLNNAEKITISKTTQNDIKDLLSRIKDAESAQRGYLLSRNQQMLDPYYRAKADVALGISEVRNAIEGDSIQLARLQKVQNLAEDRFSILEHVFRVDSLGKSQTSFTRDLLLKGDSLTARLTFIVDNMLEYEDQILAQETEEFGSKSTLSLWLIWILGGLAALVIILYNWQLNSQLTEQRHIAHNLEDAIQRFQALFDQSLQSSALLDPEGNFVDLNKPASVLFGKRKKELLGMRLVEAFSQLSDEAIATKMADALARVKQHEFYRTEINLSTVEGEDLVLDVSLNPVTNLNGELQSIIFEARDITVSKQSQNQLQLMSQLLESAERISRTGGILWNPNTKVIKWTSGAYRIMNIPEDTPITREFFLEQLEPDQRLEVLSEIGSSAEERREFEINFSRFIQEEWRYFQARFAPEFDPDGKFKNFIGTIRDVTFEVETKEQIEETMHELKRSNKELENFAYIASHDLQEPLRKIRAFGDRLKTKYADNSDFDGAEYILRMQSAAERMQVLIEDLLAFSRVSRGNIARQPVNLNTILKQVLDDLSETIEEKKAEVNSTLLPIVYSTPTQMTQLLVNIISNAIKFSRPGCNPVININHIIVPYSEVFSHEPVQLSAEKYHQISIADNGIGFKREFISKVFAIFERLHGRTAYKGTGIGMALCKKIVETHDGVITAKSTPDKGTTFFIFLPLEESNEWSENH